MGEGRAKLESPWPSSSAVAGRSALQRAGDRRVAWTGCAAGAAAGGYAGALSAVVAGGDELFGRRPDGRGHRGGMARPPRGRPVRGLARDETFRPLPRPFPLRRGGPLSPATLSAR